MKLCTFAAGPPTGRSTRRFLAVLIAVIASAACVDQCKAQLCSQLTGTTLVENFNSLAVSGSSNNSSTVPIGFGFVEAGAGGNITYAASDGSTSTGNTYSFGIGTNTDRALGEITSTVVQSTVGACFVNTTNQAIPSLSTGYAGEQWRLGAADANIDRLDFQYSTNASGLNNGTWTDVNALDFASPNNVSTGAMNGNAAANRTLFLPVAITPSSSIPPNGTFFIRWLPTNISGTNDGLAIDDFSISTPEPSTCLLLVVGTMTAICYRARRVA